MRNRSRRDELEEEQRRAILEQDNVLSSARMRAVIPKCNYTATAAPAVTDDISKAYTVGSRWINVSTDKEYVCLDSTVGAAVWSLYASGYVGVGGGVHYDYVVDASYIGAAGASLTLGTGSVVKMYATIQAAITAADADNADRSILINAGTYAENLTIATTFTHKLWLVGEGQRKVLITPSTGSALSVPATSTHDDLHFKNLHLGGASGSYSFTAAAASVPAHFEDCSFTRKVAGYFGGATFRRCYLAGGYVVDGGEPTDVTFSDCAISGECTWGGIKVSSHTFSNCTFNGAYFRVTCDIFDIIFNGCRIEGGPASGLFFKYYLGDSPGALSGLSFVDCTFPPPGANGMIWIEDCLDISEIEEWGDGLGIVIVGNTFRRDFESAYPYIKCSTDHHILGWTIAGNSFGRAADGYVEDAAGVSIEGIFIDAVFGPNSPPDFGVAANTGSAGCTYYGTGAISGTAPLTVTVALPQRGTAAPTHTAPEGTPFWDATNDKYYINSDGGTTWAQYLSLAEHTAIGTGTPHHDPVTLGDTQHSLGGGQVLSGTAAAAAQAGHVTAAAQTFGGAKTFADGILTDTIGEETATAGVTIAGALIKSVAAGDHYYYPLGTDTNVFLRRFVQGAHTYLYFQTGNGAYMLGTSHPAGSDADSTWSWVVDNVSQFIVYKGYLDAQGNPIRSVQDPTNAQDAATRNYVDSKKLDDLTAPDDNTDLDVSTTKHGLAPKAVAPAAGLINVYGIANAETAITNKPLFDATVPTTIAESAAAAAGTAVVSARRDHTHGAPATYAATAHGPSKHTAGTAWRVTYYNADGDETELALGADGTVLTSTGAGTAPAFEAPAAGGGDVATDAIWDALGDLAVGTGANTAAKLTAGANDTILMAQSGEATGLKWVASAAAGALPAVGDAAAVGTADTFARSDHGHTIAHAITNNAIATIDGTYNAPADLDYAKWTTLGLEGKSYSEVKADLDLEDADVKALAVAGVATADDYLKNDASDTTSGTITAAGFVSTGTIQLTSVPGTDHTVSGTVASFTAGEEVDFGEVCYYKSDGKMWLADATAIATAGVVAMAIGDPHIDAAATGLFLLDGFARDDSWTWTVADRLYLSETAGAMVNFAGIGVAANNVVQVVGFAVSADVVRFAPTLGAIVEHT